MNPKTVKSVKGRYKKLALAIELPALIPCRCSRFPSALSRHCRWLWHLLHTLRRNRCRFRRWRGICRTTSITASQYAHQHARKQKITHLHPPNGFPQETVSQSNMPATVLPSLMPLTQINGACPVIGWGMAFSLWTLVVLTEFTDPSAIANCTTPG